MKGWHDETTRTRGQHIKIRCNSKPARREDERVEQQENEERRCNNNKLAQQEDKRVAQVNYILELIIFA